MFYFCSLAPGNGASKHQNPGPGNRNKTFKNVIEMIARLPAPPKRSYIAAGAGCSVLNLLACIFEVNKGTVYATTPRLPQSNTS